MITSAPKDDISRVAIRKVVPSTQTFKFEDITDEFKDRLVILWPQAPGEDHWQIDFSVHPDAVNCGLQLPGSGSKSFFGDSSELNTATCEGFHKTAIAEIVITAKSHRRKISD